MKNNPIVPYILIMAFGIGLIFFLSIDGVGNKEEIASKNSEAGETAGGDTADSEAGDGEALVAGCIGCHATDLSGSVGPNIRGLDAEHIVDVLENGIEGTLMSPGLRTGDEARAIADYVSSLSK